ncbi:MAG: hypothetical protein ACM3PA_00165, partial [Methanomassiliicoccales archaeon]
GTTEDGALTIGAGNLAQAGYLRILAYNVNSTVPGRNQTAGQLYQNLTGNQVGKSSVVLVNLPQLQQQLAEANVNTQLGALGEVLRKQGLKVSVIGNGDINGELSRMAAVIGMDTRGRVALGDVGTRTSAKATDSFVTTQTNYPFILRNLPNLSEGAQLIIIELSNLARLEKADQAVPSMEAAERKKQLHEIDQFVSSVSPQVMPQDLLLVISPSASMKGSEKKNSFTPVIAKGPGYGAEALYSAATRRPYIVANTDIAPTIIQFLKLPMPSGIMVGRPLSTLAIAGSDHLSAAQELGAKTALVNRLRVPLVKGYVVLQIIVIALALLAVLAWPVLRGLVMPLVCMLVVIPLVLLLMPLIPLNREWQYILMVIIITTLVTSLAYLGTKGRPYRVFLLMSLITMIVLDLDILTGTNLIRFSALGYDPMVGARYYGIGNEFLGVLLGTSIITGIAIFQLLPARWALPVVTVFFILQSWLVAAPGLGAQSDGVITVPLAFAVTLVLLANWEINWKTLTAILVAIVCLVGGLAAYDMSRPAQLQTHVGRAASEIAQGGIGQALTIIGRKVGMNIKLIRYTIWSRVLMVILASLAVLLFWPAGAMLRIKERYPYLFKGFAGILTGAVVGGIINDSGIVAAATTSIYLVTPVLLLIIKDNLIVPVPIQLAATRDRGLN